MNTTKNNICCFFGHGDVSVNIIPMLKEEIEKLITEKNVTEFQTGGYGNFDFFADIAVKDLKKKYKFIKLTFVLAYLSQLERDKEQLEWLFDETLYPDGLEMVPQKFAITYRNRWMVENSGFMIAYVNRSYGGAYTAMNYGKNKEIHIINLADLEQQKEL